MVVTAVLPALGRDAVASFNYVRFSSLQELVGEFYSTRDLLSAVNRVLQTDQRLSDQDELGVTRSAQLRPLGRLLLAHQESQTVRGYAAIMLARYLAPFSSAALTRAQFSDQGRHIWAVTLAASQCVEFAVEDLSFATGDMLSRWFFAPDKMAAVRAIGSRVLSATEKGWLALSWIDSATRPQGLQHVRSFDVILGRHSNLSTLAQLDAYYSYFPALRGSFPEMLSAVERSRANAALKLLGASRPFFPRVRFRVPMVAVDAFYLPVYHAVVIPPAVMFAPFFDQRAPAPMNYGSLGHIIAHEVTHGLDPRFSAFGSRGEYRDWWSNESRARFQSRLACLRELYNNASVAVTGIRFGDTARGENLADAGGIRKALDAFKALSPQGAQRLGERSYFPEQLFFISSCHKWCNPEHRSRDSVLSEDITKKYSPPQMRCNVPLMNTEEFSQAFGCEDTSYMNPKKKCDVF
ncbi:neprilysin-1-like [Amblyomma americanum]